jgi:heat shock protein HtpX
MDGELLVFRLKLALATLVTILIGIALTYGVAGLIFGGGGVYLITGLVVGAFMLTLVQWLLGPYIINLMYNAEEVKPDDPNYGWLYRMIEEVALSNGFGKAPRVFIANVPFPNAFAYGSPIAGRRVAVTAPILRILSRDELKAVIGHEIGHLRHRDVEVLMAVGLLPTVIYWLGYSLFWGGLFSGSNGRNGGIAFLVGLALIAASFIVQLFVLYINRLRESYADINAVLTVPGSPRNLQRALAKIVLYMDPNAVKKYSNSTLRMFFFSPPVSEEYIVNNADALVNAWRNYKPSVFSDLLSTHPHPAKRIKMLDKFA